MQAAIDSYGPVLIVEDDARLLTILAGSLSHRGFQVHTAGTAAGARAILSVQPVAAMIVDLGLPDVSGWDLIRWSRSTGGPVPHTIVITATDRPRTPDAGVAPDALLSKPFAVDDLIHHLLKANPPLPGDLDSEERHLT